MKCDPIGTIRTPFEDRESAPRQGADAGHRGVLELRPEYEPGLAGVEAGDELLVVWYADRADRTLLTLADGRGVFASRSPDRPTPVCLTRCRVVAVDGPSVTLDGVDMLDGTPVLDLKPPLRAGR